jgi:hypothetical protein
LSLGLAPAYSQIGAPSAMPDFGGDTAKLFGDNQTFSATLQIQSTDNSGKAITMPGKISFDAGKARFEFNMTAVQGSAMPPAAIAQMKSMGLDQMVAVARPDKKIAWLIYPGMQSYVQNTLSDAQADATTNDFKIESTEIGKETVDNHPCLENKIVIIGKDGNKHEFTAWNATDLNNFPVKIQTDAQGHSTTLLFRSVSFAKPDASLFEVPSGYTSYANVQVMMQQQMMKQMGGGGLSPFGR